MAPGAPIGDDRDVLGRIGALTATLFAASIAPPPAGPLTGPAGGGHESMTLRELVGVSHGVFVGTVAGREVTSIDPGDGAPLFITTLEVRGRAVALADGTGLAPGAGTDDDELRTLHVRFPGGFVDQETGTFNSTAPPRHATRDGRGVIVFFEEHENGLGAGPGRVLVGGSAGLYTTFRARDGRVIVQGRSSSVALPHNRTLPDLESELRNLTPAESPR